MACLRALERTEEADTKGRRQAVDSMRMRLTLRPLVPRRRWFSVIKSAAVDASLDLGEFVATNRSKLRPPVSNCLLYSGQQLKVMIVGGPNQRDDFHVEAGEEFFFQLTGGMDLDLMQGGKRTRLPIKEGHAFVLPRDIPHSPQRYADTIGLVIERTRAKHELDELRWYVPNTNRVLYAEKFHCTDLGTQIKAVIDRFMASDLSGRLLDKTGREEDGAAAAPEPPIHTPPPASLAAAVAAAAGPGRHTLVDSEFQAVVYKGPRLEDKASPPWALSKVEGQEVFLLQLGGRSELACAAGNTLVTLSTGQACLLSGNSGVQAVRQYGPADALIAVHTTARLI